MIQLSVVIITLNEEKNIGRCIDSVKEIADEILVIDSFSTDKTREICEKKGARFIENSWGGYIDQKNYANKKASFPYIFSIDADEALSDELKASILKVKKVWQYDGYEMNRITNYCGKWIKHCGWYPDKKLRLFDKRKAKWTGHKIHEYVEMPKDATTSFLKGDLFHYSYYSISEHMNQANHFSDLAAEALFEKGKKVNSIKLFFSPISRFIRDYFLKLGILDGFYGFVICQISAHATYLKYVKLKQLYMFKENTKSK